MEIKQVDPVKSAPKVYKMHKQTFNRPYDISPKNVKEVVDYLILDDVYFCYNQGQLIGYYTLKYTNNSCEIGTLAILEKFQAKGYGSFIVDYILKHNPNKDIWLVTHPQNIRALFLYLRKGFEITGWIDNYFGDGQPRLKLEIHKP